MANNNRENLPNFNVKGMKITSVRKVGRAGVVFFSLVGNGLGLYNLRIVKGSYGDFIAAPQSKGNDDKYYNQYAVYFSPEDEKRIIKAVLEKIPAENERESDEDTL